MYNAPHTPTHWLWRSCCLLLTPALPGRVTPPAEPILRIDSGMHTTTINRIGIDRRERFLLTGSDDKSLRLWSLADGRLLKTLRVPIGAGNEGKLYAAALSPDGRWIAAGGWTKAGYVGRGNHNVYLFDRASGELRHRLSGLGNVIQHLCFSPDGKRLAATLGGGSGIRLWSTEQWHQIGSDSDYGGGSYWCDFSPDGRLVTSAVDGYLRLYDKELNLITKTKAPGGKDPFGAVFSPDGTRVAVGFADSTAVALLSGEDLSPRYRPDTEGIDNGDLSKVAWSRDGQRLFAGGRFNQNGNRPVVVWEGAGRGKRHFWSEADNTVMDLRPLADGGLLLGTADPAWLQLDANYNLGPCAFINVVACLKTV